MSFSLYVCMLQKLHVDNQYYLIFQCITIFSKLYKKSYYCNVKKCSCLTFTHFPHKTLTPEGHAISLWEFGYNLHLMIIIFGGILSVLEERA